MNAKITLPALLTAAWLGGCALIPVEPGPELQGQLDTWIAERRYGQALDVLSRVDPKSPHYQDMAERRRQVERLSEKYEREVVATARKDVAAGRWAKALDAYDLALERIPSSNLLRDGLAELHRQQAARVAEQELELLIRRANWLEESRPVYEKIATIAPRDSSAQKKLKDHVADIHQAASHLGKMGVAALEAGDYALADRTLPLAARLSDAEFIAKAQQQLAKWHSDRKRQRDTARRKRLQESKAREAAAKRQFTQLKQEYQSALDAGKLANARTILRNLERLAPDDAGLREEHEQLSRAIAEESERLFQEGVRLYSRGEFEDAARQWRLVLELTPEHRNAAENLERAERVLERLEQLREKQVRGYTENRRS